MAIDWDRDGLTDLVMLDQEGYLCLFRRARAADGRLVLQAPRRLFADGKGGIHTVPPFCAQQTKVEQVPVPSYTLSATSRAVAALLSFRREYGIKSMYEAEGAECCPLESGSSEQAGAFGSQVDVY